MPKAAFVNKLQAEAARCERLALGTHDADLMSRLSHWATEYRQEAKRIAGGLPSTVDGMFVGALNIA